VSLERTWSLGALAGRFIELTAAGDGVSLTATTALVHEAQTRGEPTAWIAVGSTTFYPPDLAAHGVDLGALPVVRVATNTDAARAADILVRSGSFGVVVLDLSQAVTATFPTGSQTRLTGLAKKHRTVLLALTRRNGGGRADRRSAAEGLGSLISLRGEGARVRSGFDRFTWTLQAVKDKRHGPGWTHTGTCRGPAGLC
jgi:recombination protein RecA